MALERVCVKPLIDGPEVICAECGESTFDEVEWKDCWHCGAILEGVLR